MVLPPPNVTGSLHIGHALNISIQDTIARYKKMRGYDVLWVPGTDHAGISTQVVVEKKIFRETGQTRYDLGRKDFIDKVWEWKQQYGNQITQQIVSQLR
jgi:valyl-tRNA synthetase